VGSWPRYQLSWRVTGGFRGDAGDRRETQIGPDIYQSIGIRPFINCRGTLTVISGSLELPRCGPPKKPRRSISSRWTN